MHKVASRITFLAAILITQLCWAQAPAGAPAGTTALCKDGSYVSGSSKQGACRGHKGIKEWYGSGAQGASSKPSAAPTTPKPATTTAPSGATGLCNDGSYTTVATKPGACRGHKGVKEWFASASAATAKASASGSGTTAAPPTSASTKAPADATGLCNDGTYYTGANKRGACRGHKGVKEWYAGAGPAASKGSAPAAARSPTPATSSAPSAAAPQGTTKSVASSQAPAPGGGSGQVWLNTATNVYHCEGTRFYGKTKAGQYMSEADAKAKGARPDHGKPCQ